MICIIALVVFGILGIFSATHRKLAWEALDCVIRKTTFRKCRTALDERLRSKISGKVIGKFPKTGAFIYKHFAIFSYAFTLLFLVSLVYSGISIYNFAVYGNCNGPEEIPGFCIFDPAGGQTKVTSSETCTASSEGTLKTLDTINITRFPRLDRGSNHTVVFIGCYACPYTRQSYPELQKLMREDVNIVFAHFPTKGMTEYLSAYDYCLYEKDPELLWHFNDALFQEPVESLTNEQRILDIISSFGIDAHEIQECTTMNATQSRVQEQLAALQTLGVYGTPTVFVDGQPLVGPRPFRTYKSLLRKNGN
ncbi:DsbA family protein [Candidatus Woesearchaeota archaeon]|nr:DsbA family protein [Candidatus Woesearchaeota archaeon]